jgi:hypothetical protein
MARTFAHKIATDWRFRGMFLLLGIAIAVPVGLATDELPAATIVVSVFSMVAGGIEYHHERVAKSALGPGD